MNETDIDKFKKLLGEIELEHVVGVGGLAVLCAASLLALVPVAGTTAVAITTYMSGLGLNTLAGVLQKHFENLTRQPTQEKIAQFEGLAKSLSKDIRKNAELRKEIGEYLGSFDAIRIADEILQDNSASHGWLLAQIYNDTNQYHKEFEQLHRAIASLQSNFPKIEFGFDIGNSAVCFKKHINGDQYPNFKSSFATRIVRFDLQLQNHGNVPANDIDVFLHFPDSIDIHTEETLRRAWRLYPLNPLSNSEDWVSTLADQVLGIDDHPMARRILEDAVGFAGFLSLIGAYTESVSKMV